jgi:hypothetical protein
MLDIVVQTQPHEGQGLSSWQQPQHSQSCPAGLGACLSGSSGVQPELDDE